jgi:hypothetical protein
MATRKGLEPSTSSVTGWRSNQAELPGHGGDNWARTSDPLLVRQVLSQLSYAPMPQVRRSTLYYTTFLMSNKFWQLIWAFKKCAFICRFFD